MGFSEGDYFYTVDNRIQPATYHVYYCLLIDNVGRTAHISTFHPLDYKPSVQDMDKLEIFVMHAPVDLDGFDNPVVFANKEVSQDDLAGFYTYVRYTSFEAYIDGMGIEFVRSLPDLSPEEIEILNNYPDSRG